MFKSLGKKLGKAGILTRAIDPLGISGLDQSKILPGMNDLLLGKKSKDIGPDDIANQIRATQAKGVGELNAALDSQGADQMINQQVEAQKKGVLSSAQDARRNAQRSMAQRGLSGSSLGLNLNRSIDQQAGKDINSINALQPGMLRNQKIQDATTRIGVGGINQSGMNFNTIQGQRSGGILGIASSLAPLAGTIAGGMAGGPAGAAAGGQAGQGLSAALKPDRAGGTTQASRDYLAY